MAAWILSGIAPRFNAIFQIIIILTMNIIEFLVVPDLLLWGRLNLAFAFMLAFTLYYQEFILHKTITKPANHVLQP